MTGAYKRNQNKLYSPTASSCLPLLTSESSSDRTNIKWRLFYETEVGFRTDHLVVLRTTGRERLLPKTIPIEA